MPFIKRLERWKKDLKVRLGLSSPGGSTPSLPNMRQPSPSPLPQAFPLSITPLPNAAASPTQINFGSHFLSPHASTIPSQPIATMANSITLSPAQDSQTSMSAPPVPLDPSQNMPSYEGAGIGHVRSMAWAGLETLLKVVDASTDVFPPFKSAVGGLKQCIDIFESASKGLKDYAALQSKLDSLLEDLSQYLNGPAGLMITTSMKNLSIGINEELKLVQQKSERGVVQRHAEALENSEEIMECYRRIQGYLERLALNANLSMWKLADEQAMEARLLRLLPTMSAVYNSAESEDVKRGPCTPGTRTQELAKLHEWVRDGTAGDIYWLNGMAGTGKTTIAYSLCAMLDNTAELGASFFCSRLIPECRNVKLILPAIAYQLARFSYPFQCALSRVLKADPDVHTRVLRTQFESLLMKPLLEVKDTLPADFVVVIDALDECENENSVAHILDVLLAQTSSTNLPVRFLLSSRPEPEIYSRMMNRVGYDARARLVLHDLDTETVKHDIRMFLQAELEDVHLTSPQLAALVERSGVLFIYASTAARYIKDGMRIMEHEKRLNMVLGLSPPSADGNDRAIDTLYTSILGVAFQSKHLDTASRKLTKMILDTVICAQEPTTVEGLADLLKLRSGKQVDALLRPLCSVLHIAEIGGLVTTLHASFPDFLLDRDRSSMFHCDPTANHGRIAKACFEALEKSEQQFNVCKLESSYLRDNQVPDLTKRASGAVSPALFYACRYWITHLELSDLRVDLSTLLYDFLTTRLLLWMEVLNLRKSMHLGSGIIYRAEDWSRANECMNETTKLAHDAWRFVTMFSSHAVSQSTPHIYVSMLPFWPQSAPISKYYAKRMQQKLQTRGTAMSRRQLELLATWSFGDAVRSACFSPDGTLIAFGVSSSIYVIDGVTGRTIVGPLKHQHKVTSISFSPDGTYFASGSEDTIQIWNTQSGQAITSPLTGHTDTVHSLHCSPDGTRIVSGSADETIRVWDIRSKLTVVGPLKGHTRRVYSVCYSPDGTCIASASWDRTVRVWDAHGGQMVIGPLKGHTGDINSVCFSPDGTRILSCADDKTIRAWSVQSGQMVAGPFEGHTGYVMTLGLSPDGGCLVSGSNDRTIRLWDLTSNPISVRILEGHTSSITSVAFSSDGSRIISCSSDKTIRVWDARSRATVADSLEGHAGAVTTVGYSPDGKHIVSGSADKTIRIWDAQSGQMVVGPLEGHTEQIRSVFFSPDGTRIVSGSFDRTVRVWDVMSGLTIVQVWDAHSGQSMLDPLEGHSNSVHSVCFSPNGTLMVFGSHDGTVRLWDTQNGQALGHPLLGHTGPVYSVAFSPDGKHIVSGSSDQAMRVWDVHGINGVQGVESLLSPNLVAPISSPRSHKSWVFREDGWIVDPQSHLLAWVPPDLHASLLQRHNPLLISKQGSFQLDFDSVNLGESWAGCYQPPS